MNIWEGFCEQITRQQLLMLLNSICFHEKYWKLCQLLTCVQGLLWKAQIRLDLYLLYTLYSVEQPKSVWWNLKKSVYIKFHHDLCQDRPKYLHLNVWPTFFYRWWIMGVLSSVVSPICYFHCFRWVVICDQCLVLICKVMIDGKIYISSLRLSCLASSETASVSLSSANGFGWFH